MGAQLKPRNGKPLPPLPPTWRDTVTLGNYWEREDGRRKLEQCERGEA